MRQVLIALTGILIMSTFSQAADPADSQIKAALYSIERAEQQSAGLTARNQAKMKRVAGMVEDAALQLEKSGNQSHESWQSARDRLTLLQSRLEELESADEAPPTTSAPQAAQTRAGVVTPKTPAPAANPAATAPAPTPAATPKIQAAKSAHAELGDVKARYDEIEKRSRLFVPRTPNAPFQREAVLTFVQTLDAMEVQAAEDNAWLKSVVGNTKVVTESMIETLIHKTGESGRVADIERAHNDLADRLRNQFGSADFFASSVDEAKAQHFETNMGVIYDALGVLEIVDLYEKSSGVEVMDTAAKRSTYETALDGLAARTEEAIADTRFPSVRSTDATLLAAAKEVLARPEYEVGAIQRMGITYDKQRKTTAEGDIDWGAVMTTVRVTGYEWDEFAVTTAEKEGDQYFLYYNLLKFFHVGGSDVPTGKWTLGERRKSSRILKENIAK